MPGEIRIIWIIGAVTLGVLLIAALVAMLLSPVEFPAVPVTSTNPFTIVHVYDASDDLRLFVIRGQVGDCYLATRAGGFTPISYAYCR